MPHHIRAYAAGIILSHCAHTAGEIPRPPADVVKWLQGVLTATRKDGGIGGEVQGMQGAMPRRSGVICEGDLCNSPHGSSAGKRVVQATLAQAPRVVGQEDSQHGQTHLMETGPLPGALVPGQKGDEMLRHPNGVQEKGETDSVANGPAQSGPPLKKEFHGGHTMYLPIYDKKRTGDHGWKWLW